MLATHTIEGESSFGVREGKGREGKGREGKPN